MKRYKPMLARSADKAFDSKNWIFEVKWDGIRAISYVGAELSIRSRNDLELVGKFPELQELANLTTNAVLDGEIVVISQRGDFQTLLERIRAKSDVDVEFMARESPATYVVFDILEKDETPLVGLPLIERKRLLKSSVKEGQHVILSVFVEEEGEAYYEAARARGVEGIMAKKKESFYEPGLRSSSWLKIKNVKSCDCVIFGYTKGEGSRGASFGALILGLYDKEKPVYVGKVGTGFSETNTKLLLEAFQGLETSKQTLGEVEVPEDMTWLQPKLVCEVVYQTITRDGKLRLARFRRLRLDKKALECTIEQVREDRLLEYSKRRDFTTTLEPSGGEKATGEKVFVIQEHHARRLHHDLRLEREGVLKSWAIPKGVPQQAGEKRLAVQTEDHPIEYRLFEGKIPEGEYGAGTVAIWDKGHYEPIVWEKDKVEFVLNGEKLHGRYVLAKFRKAGEKDWIMLKARE